MVGGLIVFAALRKQKCVTKNLTENGLVTLMNNIGFVELFQEFASFVLNEDPRIHIIYQDNTSVIWLVMKGG